MYAQGIKYFIDLTKLTMAARYEGDLGDLLAEKKDITNAIAAYQRAKELHEAENQPALAKQYQSKIDLLRLQS